MAKIHDGGAVRDGLVKGESGKHAHGSDLIKGILHGAVAEGVPLLQAVNAQHGLQRVGATAIADLGIDGLNDGQHPGPREQLLHSR